ncbi:MAG: LPS assembly lipoprotein LptE [Gammaproteobacteria bacterium]|nr:LPS assembly lipoprotein LptE [Gammaproteobacteria bacterium]
MSWPMRSMVILLLAACAACGFHLRGELPLPVEMQQTYLDYRGSDTDVRRVLARILGKNGVTVVRSRGEATAILRILRATVEQEVISKNIDGRPTEYRITAKWSIRLSLADGSRSGEILTAEQDTVLSLDPTDPLGARVARDEAASDLRKRVARQVLERLAATGLPAAAD